MRTDVTREQLLAPAQETPGERLGIRVAVIVLLLEGYRPTFVGRLFGPTRMTLTRWVDRLSRVSACCGQPIHMPTRSEHRERLHMFGRVGPRQGRHGTMRAAQGNT